MVDIVCPVKGTCKVMIIAMNTLACEQWPVATPARYNGELIKEQMKEMETGLIMGSTESNKKNW